MNLSDAIHSCFSKYATLEGRSRRSEYFFWQLFTFIIGSHLNLLGLQDQLESSSDFNLGTIFVLVFNLIVFIPSLAVAVRRLHDIGKSGTNLLFVLLPVIGWILLIFYCCKDSQPGSNKWGENPKEM